MLRLLYKTKEAYLKHELGQWEGEEKGTLIYIMTTAISFRKYYNLCFDNELQMKHLDTVLVDIFRTPWEVL